MDNTEAQLIERGKQAFQRQNWKEAIDCYTQAISLNPDSEAVHLRQMALSILEYYHKDAYNP